MAFAADGYCNRWGDQDGDTACLKLENGADPLLRKLFSHQKAMFAHFEKHGCAALENSKISTRVKDLVEEGRIASITIKVGIIASVSGTLIDSLVPSPIFE